MESLTKGCNGKNPCNPTAAADRGDWESINKPRLTNWDSNNSSDGFIKISLTESIYESIYIPHHQITPKMVRPKKCLETFGTLKTLFERRKQLIKKNHTTFFFLHYWWLIMVYIYSIFVKQIRVWVLSILITILLNIVGANSHNLVQNQTQNIDFDTIATKDNESLCKPKYTRTVCILAMTITNTIVVFLSKSRTL